MGCRIFFAKDINGIMAFELMMLYLTSTSSIEAGTASTLVQDDDGHDSEDSDYNTTITVDNTRWRQCQQHDTANTGSPPSGCRRTGYVGIPNLELERFFQSNQCIESMGCRRLVQRISMETSSELVANALPCCLHIQNQGGYY
jgi:hypothetical protein